MPLAPGSRFGHYEIVAMIGRGGMGEVYRARDQKLTRDVALKLLTETRIADPEWRARFEREARALAALNHPNIAGIYGFEERAASEDAPTAIVMELVDGQTLAERLDRGPLPLDESLRIAGQIAEALETAHRKGIVHRDLKPGNIKITPSGVVKVLDFGLAKSMAESEAGDVTLANTATGVVVGTPAYMAPEQAYGAPADPRVDVWAFGVVLFEMVTGRRPFGGGSSSETLAAVLTGNVDWTGVPPALQPLLRACLERDPQNRLRDIGDYRFLLAAAAGPAPAAPARGRRWWSTAAAVTAAAVIAFYAGGAWSKRERLEPLPAAATMLSTMMPAGVSVTRGPGYTSSVAVSPDGRTVIIAASDAASPRLYKRTLDRLEPTPLAGSERATSPFFSPDGKWIGFFADGRLWRVPTEGGAALPIAAAPGFSSGASWGPDDRIVFGYGANSRLLEVAAQGGVAAPLLDATPARHPEVLPNGRIVLFESAGFIHAYDRTTRSVAKLLSGMGPKYLDGRVVFSRGTNLFSAPFDADKLSVGAATPVASGVASEPGGGCHYAISRTGTLVYVPAAESYELVTIEPSGRETIVGPAQHSYENPRFSPDGRYVVAAAMRRDGDRSDLWLYDLDLRTASRLTSDGGRAPIWNEDGESITYSHLGKGQGIWVVRRNGERRQLLPLSAFHWLIGWTPRQSAMVYGLMTGDTSSILAHAAGQSRTVVEAGNIWGGRLSKDGKWLAYYMLNAGTFEIYVTPFPDQGQQRWMVAAGTDPAWSPDGREIYYRSGPRMMAARIDTTQGVRAISTRVVIDPFLPPLYDDYDVHPNGRTIVLVRPTRATQGREVTTVLNWTAEAAPPAR